MHRNIYKIGIVGTMAVLCATLVTGCKQEVGTSEDSPQKAEVVENDNEIKTYKYVFSNIDNSNPYFATLNDVIGESLGLEGHELISLDAKNDPVLQNEQILGILDSQEDIDVLFIAPVDWEGVQESLDMLQEKGVTVINLDSQIKTTTILDAYIGSDNTSAGSQAGEELIEKFPNGAKIMVLENTTRNSIIERINGFEAKTAGKGFETVARISANGEKDAAKVQVREFLQEGTNVEVIMAGNDQMALGAYEAIKELNLEVQIISIDGSPEIKELIKAGDELIIGTIAQSPINIGKLAVETSLNILEDLEYKKTNKLDTFLINANNIGIYGAESWQ